jgi:dTDP-4-dehydrorhamnose reductase
VSVFLGDVGGYNETDKPDPRSYYDICKYRGEQAVGEYSGGMVLRLNLVGIHPNGSRGKNFLEWLYDSIKESKDMTLFYDSVINPLSNWSLAGLIRKIMEEKIDFKILHLGSRDTLSKADIGKIGGYKARLRLKAWIKIPPFFGRNRCGLTSAWPKKH